MRKILYITTTIKDEGPGNLLGTLISHLDRKLYEPQVLTIQGTGKWETLLKKLSIPVINLGLRTPLDFFSLPAIYHQIKKIKPDLVHSQLITADIFGRLAARLAKVPYVTTIHNMDDWKRSYKPLSLAAKLTDARQLKRALGIVSVSRAVKDDTTKTQNIDPALITVIRNSIDLSRYDNKISQDQAHRLKQELGIPDEAVIVGTAARLSNQKDPLTWLASAKQILKSFPRVHFVWAGDGKLEKQTSKLILDNKLDKNVHLAGWRKDLPDLLQLFDIYTLVSRWEGLPLSLLEAMASAKACIASSVSGNPEVIHDRQTGLLVPSRDVKSFSQALSDLISNPQKRETLGQNAKKFVHKNFGLERMIIEYEQFYQDVFRQMPNS